MSASTRVMIRTAIQWVVSVAAVLPGLVDASGASESLPWVAAGLAVAAGITRLMALDVMQRFLDKLGLSTQTSDEALTAVADRYRVRDGS